MSTHIPIVMDESDEMKALLAKNKILRSALLDFVDVPDNRESLECMAKLIEAMPGTEENKSLALKAVKALIQTLAIAVILLTALTANAQTNVIWWTMLPADTTTNLPYGALVQLQAPKIGSQCAVTMAFAPVTGSIQTIALNYDASIPGYPYLFTVAPTNDGTYSVVVSNLQNGIVTTPHSLTVIGNGTPPTFTNLVTATNVTVTTNITPVPVAGNPDPSTMTNLIAVTEWQKTVTYVSVSNLFLRAFSNTNDTNFHAKLYAGVSAYWSNADYPYSGYFQISSDATNWITVQIFPVTSNHYGWFTYSHPVRKHQLFYRAGSNISTNPVVDLLPNYTTSLPQTAELDPTNVVLLYRADTNFNKGTNQ